MSAPESPTQAPGRNDWRDAVWASDLPVTPRMVALVYADHASTDAGAVWVTMARGLERSGIRRHETWSKAVAELQERGWLVEAVARTNKRAARYRLTVPAECENRAPKDQPRVLVSSTPECESVAVQSASHSHQTPAVTPTEHLQPVQPRQPAKPQQQTKSNNLADQLAAATRWPVDHCRQRLATKHAELTTRKDVRHPDALLASIVKSDPHSLGAPVATRRTANQCDQGDVHDRHEWADARNRYWCQGVAEWAGDPYAPVKRASLQPV